MRGATQPGLSFTLYDGNFASVRDLERGTRVRNGTSDSLEPGQFARAANYGVWFEGFLEAPADDFYQFAVLSDDGAVLEIDDETVIDNDGDHAPRMLAGHIPLRRGLHKFRLRYFQAGGGSTLDVRWTGANGALHPLEGSALHH